MVCMSWLRRLWRQSQFSVLLPLVLLAACSQPVGFHGNEGSRPSDGTQVPFQNGEPAVATVPSTDGSDVGAEKDLPFRADESLPVGTLLTVRLKTSVSTDSPETRGSFEGFVDDPVTINGATLVPRGSHVAGKVESAQASKMKGRNFVRLTLYSIDVAGKGVPVHTSSLFAHGQATPSSILSEEGGDAVIHLEQGRRLTFRLTEPVLVASQHPPSVH